MRLVRIAEMTNGQGFLGFWYIGQAMKKNLILCLVFVLLGSAQVSWRQDFAKGLEP